MLAADWTAHAFHLTDPKLVNPLFDLAEEFRVPVIVHGAAELYNCPPEFALMAARYPKVALLMAHMGYFASVGQAILFAREYPNLYLETSRVPLYEIQSAVRQLGGERVIWGTDSPYADYEWEFHKMERASGDAASYAQIVGGNIARLLRFGEPRRA